MQTLPHANAGQPPPGLQRESPGSNLASLAMTDSMKRLMQVVLKQWKSPQAFEPLARYGIFPVRQLLFFGPPGNGKTSACQWIGQQLDVPLYRVRCEQLVAGILGKTATNVGEIMDWLKKSPPAVILFDEVESLFPGRNDQGGSCAREVNSAMTVYWQHLDRWTGRHLFVMATNMPEKLDAALKSRIELHLEFGPPTPDQAREVLAYWSEVLHDHGGELWSKEIMQRMNDGESFESFRDLWQTIQRYVVEHVTQSLV